LRRNLNMALHVSWDKFAARSKTAAANPGAVGKLHRMRIAGKRLRDIMELCLPFAGLEFKRAFGRLKDVVSLMGKIHDLDDASNILGKFENLSGSGKIRRFVKARRQKLHTRFKKSQKNLTRPDFGNLIKI